MTTKCPPKNTAASSASTARKGTNAKPMTLYQTSRRNTIDKVAEEASSAYHLARRLAKLENLHTKSWYYDQYTAANPVPQPKVMSPTSSSMTPVILNTPALGVTDFERVGDSVLVKHLELMFRLEPSATISRTYRVVVFWDEGNTIQDSGAYLETGFFTGGLFPLMPVIPKDWDNKALTTQLHDGMYYVENVFNDTGQSFVKAPRLHKVSVPVNRHTQFDSDGSIVTGALRFFVITDATNSDSSFYWTSRITYEDS